MAKSKPKAKSLPFIPSRYDKPAFLIIAGILGIFLAYLEASRAIDTGSYWEYLFTLIILVISIRFLIRSFHRT